MPRPEKPKDKNIITRAIWELQLEKYLPQKSYSLEECSQYYQMWYWIKEGVRKNYLTFLSICLPNGWCMLIGQFPEILNHVFLNNFLHLNDILLNRGLIMLFITPFRKSVYQFLVCSLLDLFVLCRDSERFMNYATQVPSSQNLSASLFLRGKILCLKSRWNKFCLNEESKNLNQTIAKL